MVAMTIRAFAFIFATLMPLSLAIGAPGSERAEVDTYPLEQRLRNTIIPKITLERATPAEAIDAVRAAVRESVAGGVKIGIEARHLGEPEFVIDLALEGKTLGEVLNEIGKQANRAVDLYPEGVVMRRPLELIAHAGMVTRFFRVPPDFDKFLRQRNADPFETDQRPDNSPQQTVAEYLKENVPFPEGSKAEFDESRSIVVVTNTPGNLYRVEMILYEIYICIQRQMRIAIELYAMDPEEAAKFQREAGAGQGIPPKALEKLAAEGKAKLVAAPAVVTRSGHRAQVESGWRVESHQGGKAMGSAANEGSAKRDAPLRAGCTATVDPVIGSDGKTIDLNLSLNIGYGDFKEPDQLRNLVGEPPTERFSINSAVILQHGQTLLVGTIPAGPNTDQAHLVLLTCHIVPVTRDLPIPE